MNIELFPVLEVLLSCELGVLMHCLTGSLGR